MDLDTAIKKLDDTIKNDYSVVNEINDIYVEYCKKDITDMSGHDLARYDNLFSVLGVRLGVAVTKCRYMSDRYKAERRVEAIKSYQASRLSGEKVKDAEMSAEIEIEATREQEEEQRYRAELLRAYYDGIQNIINSIGRRRKELLIEQHARYEN